MPNCRVGENCIIGQNVMVAPEVVLGNNVKVQNNVSIYTGISCEDDVFLGPSVVFTNIINPRSAINRRSKYVKTRISKGAMLVQMPLLSAETILVHLLLLEQELL